MKWDKRSNYHLESDPSQFFLCKAKVGDVWLYTLTDRNEWVITGTKKQREAMADERKKETR